MTIDLRGLAAKQHDVVAAWQLMGAGWTRRMIIHRVRTHGWRVVHPGVYVLSAAPLTRDQLWIAATLTSPNSFLSHASAGACHGFRPCQARFETIVRLGSGGPKRFGGVLVIRSKTLERDVIHRDGIPITTAARALVDLAGQLTETETRRCFREALRLKVTTRSELAETVARHEGRAGTPLLSDLTARYGHLPYQRTRSDPEGRALELITDAGLPLPRVNTRIAGEEADLAWPDDRVIFEIDGPQYHRFPEEDARKQKRWEAAGWTVRRVSSAAVYRR